MAATTSCDQLNDSSRSASDLGVEQWQGGADATTIGELQAFVGKNSSYYLRKWAPRLASLEGGTGMNWAAFFLTAVWMGYRKMHRASAICVCAALGMTFGLEILSVYLFRLPTTPFSIVVATNLMFCLVCGVRANAWYLSHARRKIAEAQRRGFAGEQLLETLRQRGGTSLLGAFGLVFGPIVALLLLAIVLGLVLFLVGATVH